MIYILVPSHGPTGRQRPEHESLDRGEDVFPIVQNDIMPVSKDNTHNLSSKWFTLDWMIFYRETAMGKSHLVIRASHMTPLPWQHLPVPVHLSKYVCICVRNVLLTTDSCDNECEWRIELERTSEHSQCLTPNPLHPRMTVKWQTEFLYCASSSSDIQTMVQNAAEGQLAQGKLPFLKTEVSYSRKDSF